MDHTEYTVVWLTFLKIRLVGLKSATVQKKYYYVKVCQITIAPWAQAGLGARWKAIVKRSHEWYLKLLIGIKTIVQFQTEKMKSCELW